MKKILIFALLLLTLLPTFFENSYYSASAQNFAYENGSFWIPDIEVTGEDKSKVKCDCCKEKFDDQDAFERHLKYNYVCRSYYGIDDDNKEKDDNNNNDDNNNDDDLGFGGQNFCPFCNRPYDYCNCSGVIVSGNRYSLDPGTLIFPNTPPDDDNLCNTDSIGTWGRDNPDRDNSYHCCQCLITLNTRARLRAIDNNPRIEILGRTRYKFAESLKRHIAFPETIQQGNNGTCAAATIQKYLAENFPNDYIECAISLAETSEYKKWNLRIPEASYVDSVITEDHLMAEIKGHEDYIQKGIDYTSVDMLMQTAIQNWYNDKRREQGLEIDAYSPYTDEGDNSISGMPFVYVKQFLDENVCLKYNLDSTRSVVYYQPNTMSYDQLEEIIDNYDQDSYTFVAGVAIKPSDNGTYSFTTTGSANHLLEIIGTDSGYINCWTWEKNGQTSNKNCDIRKLMVLKKTEIGKQEKIAKQNISCNCNPCTNTCCNR